MVSIENAGTSRNTSYPNETDVELSLLDNAIDFILRAVESAELDDQLEWKYAVLHLAAGIELLLKARLSKVHWSLTFANVDKATRVSFSEGSFKSVDVESSICRLVNIDGVQFDDKTLADLKSIRNLRNRIQHFGFAMSIDQTKSVMASGLHFILDFSKNELSHQLTKRHRRKLDSIYRQLNAFEEFVERRLSEIRPDLINVRLLFSCGKCFQRALEIKVKPFSTYCHFCGHRMRKTELRELRSSMSLEMCYNCEQVRTLLRTTYINDRIQSTCFECGYYEEELSEEELVKELSGVPSLFS